MRWRGLQLDLATLVINTTGHRYATLENGTDWLPFGSAADCYTSRSLRGQVGNLAFLDVCKEICVSKLALPGAIPRLRLLSAMFRLQIPKHF